MISTLIAGVRQFRRENHPRRKKLFEKLSTGQEPHVLFITCSDSRIAPHLITNTEPGDLFVIRNAGNLVPPYSPGPGGEQATIEYAVAALGVKHIIVCGHADCGAMKGLLAPDSLDAVPNVASWLELAKPTKQAVEAQNDTSDSTKKLTRTIETNARLQLENLKTHPSVAAALAENTVQLHAWVYDIQTGAVMAYNDDQDKFVELNDVSAVEPAPETMENRMGL